MSFWVIKILLKVQITFQCSLTFLKLLRLVTFLWTKHWSTNKGSCGKWDAWKYFPPNSRMVADSWGLEPRMLSLFIGQLGMREKESRPALSPSCSPTPPSSPLSALPIPLPVWLEMGWLCPMCSVRLQLQVRSLMLWPKSQGGRSRQLLDHSRVLCAAHSTFENTIWTPLLGALLSRLPQSPPLPVSLAWVIYFVTLECKPSPVSSCPCLWLCTLM